MPRICRLSDGPYETEHLRSKLIGRVVGVAANTLGKPIAPEAGYQNEAGANAAFDPVEYLDVMIATGHRPMIVGDRYMEEMPQRGLTEEEETAILAVWWKFCNASAALKRVAAECIRRGLTDRRPDELETDQGRGGYLAQP